MAPISKYLSFISLMGGRIIRVFVQVGMLLNQQSERPLVLKRCLNCPKSIFSSKASGSPDPECDAGERTVKGESVEFGLGGQQEAILEDAKLGWEVADVDYEEDAIAVAGARQRWLDVVGNLTVQPLTAAEPPVNKSFSVSTGTSCGEGGRQSSFPSFPPSSSLYALCKSVALEHLNACPSQRDPTLLLSAEVG